MRNFAVRTRVAARAPVRALVRVAPTCKEDEDLAGPAFHAVADDGRDGEGDIGAPVLQGSCGGLQGHVALGLLCWQLHLLTPHHVPERQSRVDDLQGTFSSSTRRVCEAGGRGET